jgi:ParB family chromosome partitioning protein
MQFQNNSIFWVDVDKIRPNPYQPRREFDQARLNDLAESIRQYGVLQPLVVTRKEIVSEDGIAVEYELISGERRHRASKLASINQVPVIIKTGAESDQVKLELAIIENLQREDLNAIDRALAFKQLADQFNFKHTEIARKVGKSREYVSNSIRLLSLPDRMQQAIRDTQITEGHARPLMMLGDRPEEQETLFKEILYKRMTVRDAESVARTIAQDKVRKKAYKLDPQTRAYEKQLSETLGTRVQIERSDVGGKVVINFFSADDLKSILDVVTSDATMTRRCVDALLNRYIEQQDGQPSDTQAPSEAQTYPDVVEEIVDEVTEVVTEPPVMAREEFSTSDGGEEEAATVGADEELVSAEDLATAPEYQHSVNTPAAFLVQEVVTETPPIETTNQVGDEDLEDDNNVGFVIAEEATAPTEELQPQEEGEDIYSIANFTI